MRHLDGDVVARVSLPLRREGGVEFAVEFAGRIVGDVDQGLLRKRHAQRSELDGAGQEGGSEDLRKPSAHRNLRVDCL